MSTVTTGGGGTAARRAAKEAQRAKPSKPSKASKPGSASTSASRSTAGSTDRPAAPERPVDRRQLDPDVLADLEGQRTFLLASLRDLEAEHAAGDVDEVDYEALKDDYTARAAAVIRAIDDRQALRAEITAARPRSPWRIAAVAVGVLVVAVLAGVLMAQASGRRNPGDTITGDVRQDSRNLLAQAQSQFGSGQYLDAIKTYDQVLQTQPANTEALTYKGWLLYRVAAGNGSGTGSDAAGSGGSGGGQVSSADVAGLQQRALESLDAAVQADPSYPDAHIFRAIIYRDQGRTADAATELSQVQSSQVPQFMRETVDQLRAQVTGAPGGSTGGSTPSTAAP